MLAEPLEKPIRLYNIDGSLSNAGSITYKVKLTLRVGQDKEKFDFFLTTLGPENVILSVTYASKFLFVYQCLLHSRSCDQPRSIFTSISFSLRRFTIWGQEALLRTVHFPYKYYTPLWTADCRLCSAAATYYAWLHNSYYRLRRSIVTCIKSGLLGSL